jgi:hypothetical protein
MADTCTVKPVLRGHLWEIFYDRTRERWPFSTGDFLIEVTAWAGLTVVRSKFKSKPMVLTMMAPKEIC